MGLNAFGRRGTEHLAVFLTNGHTAFLEAQTEVEELRKEIEGLRKKVQEAEKVKGLSDIPRESRR